MSTNYGWAVEPVTLPTGALVGHSDDMDPRVHIGKRCMRKFIWAQDPATVLRICRARPTEELIEDEYGRRVTCAWFAEMLEPLDAEELIGERFS